MTTIATIAAADQLAAHLRDRTPTDHAEQCDAFALCADCQAKREAVWQARHEARIPQQRSAS